MDKATYELLEDRIVRDLEALSLLNLGSESREATTKEICSLVEKLNESERINIEAWDKEERRRIEEEKNQNAIAVEQAKQDVTWSRAAFEMAKVVVPIVVSGTIYGIFQKKVLKFEETGRVNSTMGRDLFKNLPKFSR